MTNNQITLQPMRSVIYVRCIKEDYRHKILWWLNSEHVPDSIQQFEPYVTKYAFYPALPVPEDGERFGTYNMQLTEHYWLINPLEAGTLNKVYNERMPLSAMKWQGIVPDLPDEVLEAAMNNPENAEAMRSSDGGRAGTAPFVFAFLPVWWEEDIKGAGRTLAAGPNYRWQFLVKYPDGISAKEGDAWLLGEVLPKFAEMEETTRILTSRVKNAGPGHLYNRIVEIWFDGPSDWHKCAVERADVFPKPSWAMTDTFPYLEPMFHIAGIFVTDAGSTNNLKNYSGYIPMR